MSKISEKLAKNQRELLQFEHNGQIKDFLVELGVESKFKTALQGERIQVVHYGEHPTHFILIALYSGHSHPRDNGFLAWCLPKRKFSVEQFVQFSQRIFHPSNERILASDMFWAKPGDPSGSGMSTKT